MILFSIFLFLFFAACDNGEENEDKRAVTEDDGDDPPSYDDNYDSGGSTDDDGNTKSCTISYMCTSGSCGTLPCWEQSISNGCEGACYVVSKPQGNNQGICVDKCEKDNDCPNGFYCLPDCPDLEGWFEVRWCVQKEYPELGECPDF